MNTMKVKIVDPGNPRRPPRECKEIQAWKLEEKQSDVSLALHAYHDALTKSVDQVVIVTNDTDIAPALQMIRQHTKATIGLVVPTRDHTRDPNAELADHSHWVRTHITFDELNKSQLPRVIPGRKATVKPQSWYPNPELFAQILELAISIRGSRSDVFKWMDEPNPYLAGQRPINLIETVEGAGSVLEYIKTWIEQNKQTS